MNKRLVTAAAVAAIVVPTLHPVMAAGDGIEPLTSVRVASGLDHTVFVTHAPGDFNRLYLLQKQGFIRVLNLRTGVLNEALVLDIDEHVGGGTAAGNEQGLLGLAFHPDWKDNRFFYVNYTDNNGDTIVERYTATGPEHADPDSAMTVLRIDQPFPNHNAGWMAFGPNDGYLSISTGDGGGAGDPGQRAQDITEQLLGKILRINVDGDDFPEDPQRNYAIPPDNPFVGSAGDDEIWAYGLRNPWRCSFDRVTGDLYIADVGQASWEEISFQPGASNGGENYGWRCYEGDHAFSLVDCPPPDTMVFPIHEYAHEIGRSVISGYVYRGCSIPSLDGTYFFADYQTARIWSFDGGGGVLNFVERTAELTPIEGVIERAASFGEDARGEVYVIDQGSGETGEVFRIEAETPTISPADFDCDGSVGFGDLLLLLSSWGPCEGCLPDLNGDDAIGFADLLDVLSQWG